MSFWNSSKSFVFALLLALFCMSEGFSAHPRLSGRQPLNKQMSKPLLQLKETEGSRLPAPEIALRGGGSGESKTLVREMVAE